MISADAIALINADARNIPLRDKSVQCVVTSPPFFQMRDYGRDGQIGMEEDLHCYVEALADVFDGVRRILRDDGLVWLNLGNKYASGSVGRLPIGYKRGDLIGIPWLVAIALQARGWWLRADVIWFKANPMPEPVKGWRFKNQGGGRKLFRGSWRPSRSHEYVFMLAKSQKYYADGEPVREKPAEYTRKGGAAPYLANGSTTNGLNSSSFHQMNPNGANKRSVWKVPTVQWFGEHCATFPPDLVAPCLKSSTPAGGCCAECEAPYARVEDSDEFLPTCKHGKSAGKKASLVLDPFVGSGTTLQVARDLGLRGVGLDLNLAYLIQDARKRLGYEALDSWKNGIKDTSRPEKAVGPLFIGR